MGHPVAGEDYPRTLEELQDWFADEAACQEYLDAIRWGEDGEAFECPRCGHDERWTREDRTSICQECQKQISLKSGTVLQGSNLSLRTWFQGAWVAGAQKHGVSAKGLQRVLGLGSYKAAWALLRKLRIAMVRPGRDRLHGHVEVDEVWLGSKVTPGSQHPGITRGKGLIAVAVETMPYRARFGRIRMRRLQGRSAADLIPFVKDSIKPGSVIHTDGHLGYNQLPQHFYFHQRYNQSQAPPSVSPTDILPAVHRVASLLKRWKMGTHHGSMSRKHLDAYLDEFTFRFNRRSSNHRGLLFHRLLQYAVALSPQTYAELTA